MENLYQYLWKFGILDSDLILEDGESLKIINPGKHNTDAGPDFSNAHIAIGSQQWYGNVEIHIRASDWYKHNHHLDPSYDSIILHAVGISDTFIKRSNGEQIPQLVLTFPPQFFSLYESLSRNISEIKCKPMLQTIPAIIKEGWFESLGIERIQSKAERILSIYRNSNYDWETTTFIILARSLGFGLNSEPFEMLARSIPLNYLRRHTDNLVQLEALLFGQAGMLDSSINIYDEYYQILCREYFFFARKYGLKPMDKSLWKYARTRPNNFPHRRIALLAKTLSDGFKLNSELIASNDDINKIRELLGWELSGYWSNHRDFGNPCIINNKALGETSINLLAINFAGPVLYAMGTSTGNADIAEKAICLWEALPAETNKYTIQWKTCGIDCNNAFRSQSLLQLRTQYCDTGNCLKCRFGNWLLRDRIKPYKHPLCR